MATTKLGDVKISVIFDSAMAARGIKTMTDALAKVKGESDKDVQSLRQLGVQLDNMATSSGHAGNAVDNTTDSLGRQGKKTDDMITRMAKINLAVEGVSRAYHMLNSKIHDLTQAHFDLAKSQRQIEAHSKLTNTSLEFLQNTAENAKENFKLSTEQSNNFTISLSKLTAKSGDIAQTGNAIKSLLDLAAARGLNAEQALVAIDQAILGIDEGTDKLFLKNPSALYAEWAAQTGVAAGKMNDMQKAQAILSALVRDGNIVAGEYLNYLKSEQGQYDQNKVALRELEQSFGAILNNALTPFREKFKETLDLIKESPEPVKVLTAAVAGLTAALVALNATGLTPVVSKKLPEFISKTKAAGSALGALFGPVGIVAVAAYLTILSAKHHEAAVEAELQAKKERDLADAISNEAKEIENITKAQLERRKQTLESERDELIKTIAIFKSMQDQSALGAPMGGKQSVFIPGIGNMDQALQQLDILNGRLDVIYKKGLNFQTTPPPPGSNKGKGVIESTFMDFEKKKKPEPIAPVSGEIRRTEKGGYGFETGTGGINEWMQKDSDELIDRYNKFLAQFEDPTVEFTNLLSNSFGQAFDNIANAMAGMEVRWDMLFKNLKASLIKFGMVKLLDYIAPGAGTFLAGGGLPSAQKVSGGSIAGAENIGRQISAFESSLTSTIKQGLNRPIIVQGALSGQRFYVKSVLGEGMKFNKRTF